MKVVITGARGFLGSHLVRALKKQKKMDVATINHENSIDRFKLKNATKIIHFAGVNRGTKDELRSGNVKYTEQLLSWVKEYSPKASIIFASTSQVYVKDWFYGEMKLRTEKVLESYSAKYKTNCICLRLSNVYGPFCRPFYNSVIATFIYQIMHGNKIIVNGNGSQRRDFLYVTDAVGAIQKAMLYNPNKAFSVYDICSGSLVSLKSILQILRKIHPNHVVFRYNLAWKDKPVPKVSNSRARIDLGWQPAIPLSEGLRNIFIDEYGIKYIK